MVISLLNLRSEPIYCDGIVNRASVGSFCLRASVVHQRLSIAQTGSSVTSGHGLRGNSSRDFRVQVMPQASVMMPAATQ